MITKSVESKIRNIRLAKKITKEDVAYLFRKAGMKTSLSTITRWEESGRIRLDQARLLAEILGVPLAELL